MTDPIASVFNLSPAEKLQLVEDLWDNIAASSECVPIHDWQIEELQRREAAYEANPQDTLSWEEVKRQIRNQHGR
jgi:putative addiction module component (TIGR02574 family)